MLSQRQPTLASEAARTQPGELSGRGVPGTVDDPQVLPASALQAGLLEAFGTRRGEPGVRLDHHAFSTGAGVGNDVTTTYAVVRVGGLISVVSVEQDLPAEMKALAVKAVNRLCAAEPGGC